MTIPPGPAEYIIVLPDGKQGYTVNLGAGAATDLQTLITLASSVVTQDAAQTVIDAHVAAADPHTAYFNLSRMNTRIGDTSINNVASNTPSTKVYLIGDSLTAGTPGGMYQTYLDVLLGASFPTVNKGAGAETSTQIAARIYTDVIDKGDAGYCIILAGTNNIDDAATVKIDLQAMYTACHLAGIKVIACTLPPRSTQPANVLAVNAWIASTAINIDYVVDLYAVLNDPANPGHYLAALTFDDIHPNEAGCSAIADAIYAAVTGGRCIPDYPTCH